MSATSVRYFTAPWCAPCKKFRPVVDRVAAELDLAVVVLNIDEPEGARQAAYFNVTSVPTVIVEDGDGGMGRYGVLPPVKLKAALETWT